MYVLWSVVGFFVILSFWGMVNILTNTFKLDSSQPSGFFGTFGSSNGVNTSPFTQRSGGTTVTPTSAGTTITPNSAGTTERRGLLTGVRDFFVEGW